MENYDNKVREIKQKVTQKLQNGGLINLISCLNDIFKIEQLGKNNYNQWFKRATTGEIKGLKYFFKKYKPTWQQILVKLILKIGIINRIILFSILNDKEKRKVYLEILKRDE